MHKVTMLAAVAALLIPCAALGQVETDTERKSQEDFRLPLEIKTGEKACYQVTCRKDGSPTVPSTGGKQEKQDRDRAMAAGYDKDGDTALFTLEPTRGNQNGNAMITLTVAPSSSGYDRDAGHDRDAGDDRHAGAAAKSGQRTYMVEVDRSGRIVRLDRQSAGAIAGDPANPDERPVAAGTRETLSSDRAKDDDVRMALACIFGSGLHERALTTGQVYVLDTGSAHGLTPSGTERPALGAGTADKPRIGLKFLGVTGEDRDDDGEEAASRKGRIANFSVVPASSVSPLPATGNEGDAQGGKDAAGRIWGTASYHADTGCLESLTVSRASAVGAGDPASPGAGGQWISIRWQPAKEDGHKDDDDK